MSDLSTEAVRNIEPAARQASAFNASSESSTSGAAAGGAGVGGGRDRTLMEAAVASEETTTQKKTASNPTRGSNNHFGTTNRFTIAIIVYFALLLDNVLLTAIVPILPDFLASMDNKSHHAQLDLSNSAAGLGVTVSAHNLAYRNADLGSYPSQTIMTKHPIPGKSLVNFSLLQVQEGGERVTIAPLANNSVQQVSRSAVVATTDIPIKHDKNGNTVTSGNAEDNLNSENGSIGILLAMKALVQLIFNPIVGNLSNKYGYRVPIVFGTFCLLISSLVFAIGETYATLLIARSIQGVGSACIGVCGMSLVAQHYPEEERRSKVMGIILGSIALGVLLGYPIGGILYDLAGKSTPFIILSTVIFLNLGMQLLTMDLSVQPEVIVNMDQAQQPKWKPLLENKMILAIVIAIWFSTSTMAILEPCLPIWLIQHLKPYKWQLGAVFIPDSFGYFVGTNFFGSLAYRHGQVRFACISLLLVGISSILIPSATSVWQLLLPHFGLGLGIGIIDAALVPLLATFVDATLSSENAGNDNEYELKSMSSYGTVYAIQQTSVSLAYCLAPLLGGELAEAIGFAWLMRIVGFMNVVYGPILVVLYNKYDPKTLNEKRNQMLLSNTAGGSQYNKLYNSVDVE